MVDARGNLDTRIRNLEKGKYHAIVVAAAGVERLRMQNRVSEIDADIASRPGPRIVDAVENMLRLVHPDLAAKLGK